MSFTGQNQKFKAGKLPDIQTKGTGKVALICITNTWMVKHKLMLQLKKNIPVAYIKTAHSLLLEERLEK